jgi:uncharacterized damage-inducible protein DinB
MLARPDKTEYSSVYENSITKVPDGNVLEILEKQIEETVRLLSDLDEEKASYRYAPGKWSIKQVVGHMTDSERIFSYRALRFAREDPMPLPGYEENEYVDRANFDSRSLKVLLEEFRAVRVATLALFRSFDNDIWLRQGTASGCEFSVRALAYQMAGHEIHHVGVIKERYL